jgi:photosystem II stability/assembly factor-like uncharacterized protein
MRLKIMKKAGNIIIVVIAVAIVVSAAVVLTRPHQKAAVIIKNQIESNLFAGAVLTDTDMLVVGDLGKAYLSSDAGKTWQEVQTPTRAALLDLSMNDDKSGWAAGQAGVILHTADGGKTWTVQKSGVEISLLGIHALDALHACAVGADSTVIVTEDGGATWVQAARPGAEPVREGESPAAGFNLFGVRMTDPETICVSGYMGRIFLTKDAGKTWAEIKSPLYDAENQVGRTIFTLAGGAGGVIAAAGVDMAVLLSKDNAITWAETDAGVNEPEIFGIDLEGQTVLAAGSAGTVLVSSDAGATWKKTDVPEMLKRAWLSGVDLKSTPSGIKGIIAGQYGITGIYENGNVSWHIPVIPEVQ